MQSSPHTALAKSVVEKGRQVLPPAAHDHYKDLQSLLPGISRLEAKSYCLMALYGSSKIVLPSGLTVDLTFISHPTGMHSPLERERTTCPSFTQNQERVSPEPKVDTQNNSKQ